MLFLYFKGPEKEERWKAVALEHAEERIKLSDVAFSTVLAVNEKPAKGESVSENAEYFGPLYIDIDVDKDIAEAISAAQQMVRKLVKKGVPSDAIELYASGKRGFHIMVPMEVFTEPKPVRKLPLIYKKMVEELEPHSAVDMSVYSTGKGRMWRVANKQRPDNGKYKVQLPLSSLWDMSPADYNEYVAEPRPKINGHSVHGKVPALEALFNIAKDKAEKMVLPKGVFIDPVMKESLGSALPPCLHQMINWQQIKPGAGFNNISLQVAKGIAAFQPELSDELSSEFAEKSEGTSYNTPAKRKDHVRRALNITLRNKQYDWSCRSALGVISNEPCFNCPIAFIRTQQDDMLEEDRAAMLAKGSLDDDEVIQAPVRAAIEELEGNDSGEPPSDPPKPPAPQPQPDKEPDYVPLGFNSEGLIETESGYSFINGKGEARRISNFTLNIKDVLLQYVENVRGERRVAVKARVRSSGKVSGDIVIEENCWDSKAGFKNAVAGLSNSAFFGLDDDVHKIKSVLMFNVEATAKLIRRVHSTGVQRQKIGDVNVMSYVEPGWSVDQYGNINLTEVSGKVPAHPELKFAKDLTPENCAEVTSIISDLTKINYPQRIVPILGWTMACFLKQHIFAFRNEFPLLSLHGKPGSGKTQTISLFAALHGVDFRLEHTPVNLPNSTDFVLWRYISSSTTVPRLLEEFNKSKLYSRYEKIGEILKSCWNEHSVERGTVKNSKLHGEGAMGANVVSIPLTGPVAICSEQKIAMPALVERTVQVEFFPLDKDKEFEADCIATFHRVAERIGELRAFARACYMDSLNVTTDQVKGWIKEAESSVPDYFMPRPRYAYQICLVGIKYLKYICEKHSIDIGSHLDSITAEFSLWMFENKTDLASSKQTSEVDIIVGKWASMAAMSSTEGQIAWLVKGSHYLRHGDLVYIDGLVGHAQYLRYMAQVERSAPVIENIREFYSLIAAEDYCISKSEVVEGFAKGRPVLALSISKLLKKGIYAEAFEDSE